MKRNLLLTAFAVVVSINFASARGRIPVCFPCESLETVQELPDSTIIEEAVGKKVNISYIHDEYGVLWLALWNSNGRFVLADESNTEYYDIDDETAQVLKDEYDFDIEKADNPLSFWKKAGGKLVFVAVILGFGWLKFRKSDDD